MATQLFTTTDGKTARLVNPYAKEVPTYDKNGQVDGGFINYHWLDFEEKVVSYPIHSDKPIGAGTFEGELVWQGKDEDISEWSLLNEKDVKLAQALYGYETRQVVRPPCSCKGGRKGRW